MSTINHVSQAALRIRPVRRLTLVAALVLLTAAALTAGIVAFSSSNAASTPSHAEIQRQLEAVSGPRYGLARPAATPTRAQLEQQLQAVNGARYHQPRP